MRLQSPSGFPVSIAPERLSVRLCRNGGARGSASSAAIRTRFGLSETSCSGCREHPGPPISTSSSNFVRINFSSQQLEQVTAGVDVQGDRLVYVVLGFSPDNLDCWVLDYGVFLGDPREDSVWETLAAKLSRPFGGLPPSVVSVDAGFLTSTVQAQCAPAPSVVDSDRR